VKKLTNVLQLLNYIVMIMIVYFWEVLGQLGKQSCRYLVCLLPFPLLLHLRPVSCQSRMVPYIGQAVVNQQG